MMTSTRVGGAASPAESPHKPGAPATGRSRRWRSGLVSNQPAASITWNVPKDCAEKEVDVIISASDALRQEVFHSFKIGVVAKATLPR